jgi:NAD(P)-dependent dehydrogenase (short-subunit alcohol dehydrogenase family)
VARRSPYFNLVEVDKRGNVQLSKVLPDAIVRRQDSPKCYDMNASIYVWNREALFNNNSVFNADTLLYEMPEERSFDIDSELDFEFVSYLMGKMNMSTYNFLFDLTGKTAIVTGGAGILGKKFCEGLAAHGANVAVVDIDREAACDLATQLRANYSGEYLGIGCDVSDPVDVARMVEETTGTLGGIQILHNNAAWKSTDLEEFFRRFEEYRLDQWRKIMSVNIDGMFLVAQAVGKQMLQQGTGGSIIQTSSIYAIMAPDQRIYEGSENMGMAINTPAVYSASKAAVIGLTKYLAAYWADQGIRVNALTPGGNESGQNEEFVRRYSSRVPMRRMAKPTEMVGALLYLASDASSYVTGQNVVVDGGLSCW